MTRNSLVGWVMLAASCGSAGAASAQSVTYVGSVQVSNGDYIFADRTTSFYLVNGLEVVAGPVSLSATVPVIGQSTPWVTYGPTPVPSGGAQGGEVARQIGGRTGQGSGGQGRLAVVLPVPQEGVSYSTGIGDPLVRADVAVASHPGSRTTLRLNASAKIPIADPESGFGTGVWDYGAGISLATAARRANVFVDVSYWEFGDLPDLALKGAVAYGVAYGQVLGAGRWSVLTSISGWTPIVDGADPPIQLGIGVSRLVRFDRSVALSVGIGVTESAPDISIALGWRLGL
jgi:hypothetical protein